MNNYEFKVLFRAKDIKPHSRAGGARALVKNSRIITVRATDSNEAMNKARAVIESLGLHKGVAMPTYKILSVDS